LPNETFNIRFKSKTYAFLWITRHKSELINYIEILYINHKIKLSNLISRISITNFNNPVLVLINWQTVHGHRAVRTLQHYSSAYIPVSPAINEKTA